MKVLQLLWWNGDQRSVRGKSYLMQRVPPVMGAILPCSAHLTGASIAMPVNICSGHLSASPGPVCVATGLSMRVLNRSRLTQRLTIDGVEQQHLGLQNGMHYFVIPLMFMNQSQMKLTS